MYIKKQNERTENSFGKVKNLHKMQMTLKTLHFKIAVYLISTV